MAKRLEKLIDKATPRYTITLPLTKTVVTYRPFLVKEEKVLLISTADLKDDDIAGRYRAIVLLLENCTDLDDVGNLPLAEVDWLFVQIRAKSVNNIVKANYTCPTSGNISIEVDLEELKIEGDLPDPKIMLTDNMGITVSVPTLNDTLSCYENADTEMDSFCILKKTIQEIYTEDDIITREEMDEDDLDEFINSMINAHTVKIYDYFSNIPRIQKEIIYTSGDTTQKINLTNIRDILALSLSHISLSAFYEINFSLMQHHNYSLADIESMIPWEREVYINYLKSWLEEQKKAHDQQKRSMGR